MSNSQPTNSAWSQAQIFEAPHSLQKMYEIHPENHSRKQNKNDCKVLGTTN